MGWAYAYDVSAHLLEAHFNKSPRERPNRGILSSLGNDFLQIYNCNEMNKIFIGGLQGREILMAGTRYLIWHFNTHGIVTRSVKFVYRIAQDRVRWIEAAGANRKEQ